MSFERIRYTGRALSRSIRLGLAYTDSVDGDVVTDVDAVLQEVGHDRAELRDLVASLAGLAGHAVMVITERLEASLEPEQDPARRMERFSRLRTTVIEECAAAVRESRPASPLLVPRNEVVAWDGVTERRSGLDRRLGTSRRSLPANSPSARISLRMHGERRVGISDRRIGIDRRGFGAGGASARAAKS
jgi:hypothetical protein